MAGFSFVERGVGMLNQPLLIGAVLKEIDRQGLKRLCARHMNAVIAAVDGLLEELGKPYRPAVPGMGFRAWLFCDDVGESSRFMAQVLCGGVALAKYAHPHDVGDFLRCVKMLDAVGVDRSRVSWMSECSAEWSALVERWEEIEGLLAEGDLDSADAVIRAALERCEKGSGV